MKHFLVKGDAACTWDCYFCFDCQRIWYFADACMGHPPYWGEERFQDLEDESYWNHGVIGNNYPAAAFLRGIESFAEWVQALDSPEYAVGPV